MGFIVLLFAAPAWGQLSHSRHKYHSSMPLTSDAELQSLFDDQSIEWYTEDDRPKLYQQDLNIQGQCQFISIYKDVGPGRGRISNGNREFPWAFPATADPKSPVKNVIGVRLAGVEKHRSEFQQWEQVTDGRGNLVRVERDGVVQGSGWTFADGTEFVELNTTRIGDYDYPFKVHRMTKRDGVWFFKVYRPFTNQADYERATGTKVESLGSMAMQDSKHRLRAFKESRIVLQVPPIAADLSAKLLNETPFKLCRNDDFIPTTDHDDQIYPNGYLGAFLGNATDQAKCRNCHHDVTTNVRKFSTGEWYGQIRGGGRDKHGAGVFSWYPR